MPIYGLAIMYIIMVRMFAYGPEDGGSILEQVIPKNQ